ncbi:heavy-metal-associated domain-containing protein [Helcococcus kunzii]|uniref:heavy-metal-associated domain-containing protein n=1 Tax=Helcococcus kunzii TaxID=40091 RepID=UPI001BB012CC|nr:heavy-metal-associated domain-containing protein [Helcococcus kunzii]QUY64526.1 heavy-metal-associated domain-containing protein [Helcococcus kunzii]
MKQAILQLETLTCPSCMKKIECALKNIEGIEEKSIKVLFNASKVKLNFNEEKISLEKIKKIINEVGYVVENIKEK